MRSVLILLALGGAVNALPKLNLRDQLQPRADTFCNVTAGGNTVVGECVETLVNSDGHTVISGTSGAITLATGVTTAITTTLDGKETTITPSDLIIQTTDSVGETVFSHGTTAVTISTGITTHIETVLPNGESTTITPVVVAQTGESLTTNSKGSTVISNTDGTIILPTGVTTPITTTLPDGKKTTITPESLTSITSPPSSTSSSTSVAAIIIPVTTSIDGPKHTDGGVIVPCNYFYFFDICPKWDDISIFGWFIKTPDGVHPPGPPPGINPPPGISISISIPTPLPHWPQWTLPPGGTPKPPPKPDDCKPETGEACFYHTKVSPVTTNQATTTTTIVSSTCATVTGCEATDEASSTTTTASGTPTILTYAVYPSDGTNKAQVTAIASQLHKFVNDTSDVVASNTETFGLNYWLLPLEQDSVDDVRKLANVASVNIACGLFCPEDGGCGSTCHDPTIMRVYQTQYPPEGKSQLSYLSWGPNSPRPDNYLFEDSAGNDVKVYIVDTGANLGHQEFDLIRDKTEWLVVPFDDGTMPPAPHTDVKNSRQIYHGTAMLSLVAGKQVGVAKKAKPVVVRLPSRRIPGQGQGRWQAFSPESWLRAIGMVLDAIAEDLGANKLPEHPDHATSVVLLADHFKPGEVDDGFITRNFAQLDELAKRGAVVVTGSGNTQKVAGKPDQPINGWPANFGKDDAGALSVESLIVAGAIYPGSEATQYTGPTSGVPHFYAPGEAVQVAGGDPQSQQLNVDYRTTSGTSDAAAMTAGLAAFFIGLSQAGRMTITDRTPLGIKNLIARNAWSRFNTSRKGIYNLADPKQNYCPWDPATTTARLRRAAWENDDAQCPAPSVPFVPMDQESHVCHDEADFPGHADIQAAEQGIHDQAACALWTGDVNGKDDTILHPGDARLQHTYLSHGVNYTYSVEWVDGCTTTAANQSVYSPAGPSDNRKCYGIFGWCFTTCNNGGVGGSYQIGCLKYTFTGGKGPTK